MNGLALCSGIGGLELGLKLAVPSYKTVCHIEREAFSASVIVARMEDSVLDQAPIWDDLTTFDGKPWCGIVDIVSAGFPCQPFSVAGKREGTKDDRWIWSDIERILREVEPGFVFLENVPGLLSGGIEHVLGSLASMGLDAEWGVFSATQCGAPHKRKRLFILAHRYGKRHKGARSTEQDGRSPTSPHCSMYMENAESTRAKQGKSWVHPSTHTTSEELGNPASFRCDRLHQGPKSLDESKKEGWLQESTGRCVFLWPPGPNDTDGWSEALKRDPSAIPSLCGMADGLSPELVESIMQYRADRLRALGNAVVPIVAAYAFRVLMKRLEVE